MHYTGSAQAILKLILKNSHLSLTTRKPSSHTIVTIQGTTKLRLAVGDFFCISCRESHSIIIAMSVIKQLRLIIILECNGIFPWAIIAFPDKKYTILQTAKSYFCITATLLSQVPRKIRGRRSCPHIHVMKRRMYMYV